jgi:hypothetical protein
MEKYVREDVVFKMDSDSGVAATPSAGEVAHKVEMQARAIDMLDICLRLMKMVGIEKDKIDAKVATYDTPASSGGSKIRKKIASKSKDAQKTTRRSNR